MTLDPISVIEACQRPASGEPEWLAALLTPSGAVAHATGDATSRRARDTLTVAVRRTSPEEAAMLWKGLVEGRWTLIDHLEAGGRRLVLARRNSLDRPDSRALTAREREVLANAGLGHSDKYVGYLLGVTAGTVADHLAVTRHKLGLKTRRELIAFAAAAGLVGAGGRPGATPGEKGARRAGVAEP